jgi:N-acylglucosamine 2-epimerase
MMTAWLTCELDWLVPKETQLEVFENCIHKILDVHYNPQNGLLHEYVSVNGEILDTYDGRLINPGHGIEAMWFLMDIAVKVNNPSLITKATDICLQILEYGWDKEHGGIFYFLDAKGVPLQQLEWDQKLWWVHQEALIALSRAYMHTRRKDVIDWYDKVHEYSWKHFPDISNGEWYGYLKREGQPLNTSKGGKWKGCFHSPRAMYECWKNFQNIPV